MVLWRGLGGRSSAVAYHPLRHCHASASSPPSRWPTILTPTAADRCCLSSFRWLLIVRTNCFLSLWYKSPWWAIKALWSMRDHIEDLIQVFDGRSLGGGFFTVACSSSKSVSVLLQGPNFGGVSLGNGATVCSTAAVSGKIPYVAGSPLTGGPTHDAAALGCCILSPLPSSFPFLGNS